MKKDLDSMFEGRFSFEIVDKLGDNYKAEIVPMSRLVVDNLSKSGQEKAEPYPEPCKIFMLRVPEKEITNKDTRTKKLTWFINECVNGEGSYRGIAVPHFITKLEADGVICVSRQDGYMIIERDKF